MLPFRIFLQRSIDSGGTKRYNLLVKISSIEIIKKLREKGFEAYWAGGCVRDMLLGITPKDFDIATSAKPAEIKSIFEKVIPIGEAYGVVLIEQDGHHFEVATFRSDSGYSDGRRPDAVIFTSAQEDASRRDFTINALFYDPINDTVLDFVGGQKDLDIKLVRFIGTPHERIIEDNLRILRAIRFKNTYNFQYHPDTFAAVKQHAQLAKNISGERVRDELNKMIMSPTFKESVEDLEDTGVLEVLLPEVQKMKGFAQPLEYHREGDLWDHMIKSVQALDEDSSLALRWAVFLHDVGKTETFSVEDRIRYDHHAAVSADIAKNILKRLCFSKKIIDEVYWLIKHHMSVYQVLDMAVGRRRHWFLQPYFLNLLELNRCDCMGAVPQRLSQYEKVRELYRSDLDHITAPPPPFITGEDVMRVRGLDPGPKVGELCQEARYLQLEGVFVDRDAALQWLKDL